MTAERTVERNSLDTLVLLSLIAILVSLAVAVCIYRLSFSGELSTEPNHWAAFGSYIGGIFSPLVAFATLLAIVRTIQLQRRFLQQQTSDFSSIHKLQLNTFNAQEQQLAEAKLSGDFQRVASHKQTILKTLEQQVIVRQHTASEIRSANLKAAEIAASNRSFGNIKIQESDIEQKEEMEDQANKLNNLSVKIAITEYSSVEELNREFIKRFTEICPTV